MARAARQAACVQGRASVLCAVGGKARYFQRPAIIEPARGRSANDSDADDFIADSRRDAEAVADDWSVVPVMLRYKCVCFTSSSRAAGSSGRTRTPSPPTRAAMN